MKTARSQTAEQLDALDESRLVALARTGDAAVFRVIMTRNNQRLYRVARGIVGDDAEAEDVVQEAYVRAFEGLDSFRGDSALSTWLTRIVINEALGRKRKRRPMIDIATLDMPGEQKETRVLMFPGLRADSNPETDASRAEIRRMLERAVDGLPEAFRIVFIMREVEQMSVEETATHLQIKPETVKTRLHRAKRLLREALRERLGATLQEAYSFDGERCERMTAAVLKRLGVESKESA